MTAEDNEYAAAMFRLMITGYILKKPERDRLQTMLDRMEAPGRAGIAAAIIKIMLED